MDDYIKFLNKKFDEKCDVGESIDDIRLSLDNYDTIMSRLMKRYICYPNDLPKLIVNDDDCKTIVNNIDHSNHLLIQIFEYFLLCANENHKDKHKSTLKEVTKSYINYYFGNVSKDNFTNFNHNLYVVIMWCDYAIHEGLNDIFELMFDNVINYNEPNLYYIWTVTHFINNDKYSSFIKEKKKISKKVLLIYEKKLKLLRIANETEAKSIYGFYMDFLNFYKENPQMENRVNDDIANFFLHNINYFDYKFQYCHCKMIRGIMIKNRKKYSIDDFAIIDNSYDRAVENIKKFYTNDYVYCLPDEHSQIINEIIKEDSLKFRNREMEKKIDDLIDNIKPLEIKRNFNSENLNLCINKMKLRLFLLKKIFLNEIKKCAKDDEFKDNLRQLLSSSKFISDDLLDFLTRKFIYFLSGNYEDSITDIFITFEECLRFYLKNKGIDIYKPIENMDYAILKDLFDDSKEYRNNIEKFEDDSLFLTFKLLLLKVKNENNEIFGFNLRNEIAHGRNIVNNLSSDEAIYSGLLIFKLYVNEQ